MTYEAYVEAILKKLRFDQQTKERVETDLRGDISARLDEGETMEEIIASMGAPGEVAENLEECMPAAVVTQHKGWRWALLILAAVLAIAFAFASRGDPAANASQFSVMPMQIVWLVALVACLVLEAATVSLVCVWFAMGSLVSLLISVFAPDALAAQLVAFLVVSILALLSIRPLAKKGLQPKPVPTNADANIGKQCRVIIGIEPGKIGRVELEGLGWAARSDDFLPIGATCTVHAIDGVKLVVSPAGEP